MSREDLTHDEPRYGAEAEREGDDVRHEGGEGEPRGLLVVEMEGGEGGGAHGHAWWGSS